MKIKQRSVIAFAILAAVVIALPLLVSAKDSARNAVKSDAIEINRQAKENSERHLSSKTILMPGQRRVIYGQRFILTAEVVPSEKGPEPTGEVDLFVNGAPISFAPLVKGSAQFQADAADSFHLGDNKVTALYKGDANFGPSQSAPSIITVLPVSERKEEK